MGQHHREHQREHKRDEVADKTGQLLAQAAGPAFAISLDTLSLTQATPAGEAWLRLPLDAAMPALMRLRVLAVASGAGQIIGQNGFWRREQLTFWTPEGVCSPCCAIAFVQGATGEKVAVVVVEPMDADAIRPQSSAEGSVPPRDDAATLREIARRIREGQRQLQGTRASDEEFPMPGPVSGGAPLREATGDMPGGKDSAVVPGETGRAASEHHAATGSGSVASRDAALSEVRFDKLAHELKTPLSAIAAAAEIMRDERLGPIENARYKSYAADIVESARHALQVIANMLGDQASRGDVGKPAALQPMVFAELDLNAIAESSASSMRPLAEAAALHLDVQLLPRLPHVIVDATAVRQIVLNLLTNAVKFTPAGGKVTLTTRYTAQGEVEIEIADTGRGMTQDDMARIKDAEPERTSAAREGGGFGLGLPLVGALARANGAEVVPSSREGQGTRVAVVFRRDRVVPV